MALTRAAVLRTPVLEIMAPHVRFHYATLACCVYKVLHAGVMSRSSRACPRMIGSSLLLDLLFVATLLPKAWHGAWIAL